MHSDWVKFTPHHYSPCGNDFWDGPGPRREFCEVGQMFIELAGENMMFSFCRWTNGQQHAHLSINVSVFSPHLCVGFLFLVGHSRACSSRRSSRCLLPHNLSTHNLSTNDLSTHNLLTHNLSTHNLSTHNFPTHTTYSHPTSSHTTSSHTTYTQLTHTQLPHT